MLNEGSDRPPPRPRRRFYARGEIWLMAMTWLVLLVLVWSVAELAAG